MQRYHAAIEAGPMVNIAQFRKLEPATLKEAVGSRLSKY